MPWMNVTAPVIAFATLYNKSKHQKESQSIGNDCYAHQVKIRTGLMRTFGSETGDHLITPITNKAHLGARDGISDAELRAANLRNRGRFERRRASAKETLDFGIDLRVRRRLASRRCHCAVGLD
jgi:hypothetical protein